MTSIRDAFTDQFGEANAKAIEAAAEEHANGVNDQNRGTDPFKWALLIAIGYECAARYADYHGVTVDPDEFKTWIYENADLASHDGDCDYLSAFGGGYDGWVKNEATS